MADRTDAIKRLRRQLQGTLFDVSREGVLLVRDPALGALDNRRHEVRVRLSTKGDQLILEVRGDVEESFPLGASPTFACQEALKMYLRRLQEIVRKAG